MKHAVFPVVAFLMSAGPLRGAIEDDPLLAPMPAALLAGGETPPAGALRFEATRAPLDDVDGARWQLTLVNDGAVPLTLGAIELLGGMEIDVGADVRDHAIVCFPRPGDDAARPAVLPATLGAEGRYALAAARPDGSRGVALAVLPAITAAGASGRGEAVLRAGRAATGRLALFARVPGPPEPLAPGARFAAPPVLVVAANDGGFALDVVLEESASDDSGAPPRVPPAPTGAMGVPPAFVRVSAPGGDVVLRNPIGRPLDLFRFEVAPGVFDLVGTAPGTAALLLCNVHAVPGTAATAQHHGPLRIPRVIEAPIPPRLGPAATTVVSAIDVATGKDLGRFRGRIALPVLPGPAREVMLRTEPADAAAAEGAAGGIRAWLVTPDLVRGTSDATPFDPSDPDAYERLGRALLAGGVLVLDHVGRDVITPLPKLVRDVLDAEIVPYRATAVRAARDEVEGRFLERSSNLAWLLDKRPLEEGASGAVLLCPQAGPLATPIGGVIADGVPAARGFAAPVQYGLVLAFMDEDPAAIEALARRLKDSGERGELIRAAAVARGTQWEARADDGLAHDLGAARARNVDLVPADPALPMVASAFVFGTRTVRTLWLESAGESRPRAEPVMGLTAPMTFALDVPATPLEDVLVVVRRAPGLDPGGYELLADNVSLGRVGSTTAQEDPESWQEDVFRLGPEVVQGRQRLAMEIRPTQTVLEIARIAFLRQPIRAGERLERWEPARAPEGFRRVAVEDHRPVRAGERAFVDALILPSGAPLAYALDGRFEFLEALVLPGPRSAAARLRVRVDGEERPVSTGPIDAGSPLELRVPVHGAARIELESLVPDGGPPATLVIASPRLKR